MASFPVNPQSQSWVSRRFRAHQEQTIHPKPVQPVMTSVEVGSLCSQNELQAIERLAEDLRSAKKNLTHWMEQFTSDPNGLDRGLANALLKLREALGKQKWQLERPRRYRMQIVVSGAQYLDEVTVHQVECFNRINEYCSLVIRLAVTLENSCAEYLSNMEASRTKARSDTTNQPMPNIGMVSIFLNPSPDGKLPDVEKRVRAAREMQTKMNKIERMVKEAEVTMNLGRKLFNELVDKCATHLLQSDI
ncbi:hypothetical protein X801_01091 [Opisthorchis viverrini]|uniref:Uncharacterized protein n=1 Tax=Opisthorchis viverrini TaxID=6198 RepID=A0A1S8X8G5_OPIVI|nr:hypothetical protein X801_01091 [Opisthorchis viverrini]